MPRVPTIQGRLAVRDTRTAMPAPKQRAQHYGTPEHRAWAGKVIEGAGGACQGCGRTGTRLFADHVVELRDGGDPFGQGQALCGACHAAKTAAARAARQARGR